MENNRTVFQKYLDIQIKIGRVTGQMYDGPDFASLDTFQFLSVADITFLLQVNHLLLAYNKYAIRFEQQLSEGDAEEKVWDALEKDIGPFLKEGLF